MLVLVSPAHGTSTQPMGSPTQNNVFYLLQMIYTTKYLWVSVEDNQTTTLCDRTKIVNAMIHIQALHYFGIIILGKPA